MPKLPDRSRLTVMDLLSNWIVPPGSTVEPAIYITVAILALAATAVSKGGFGGGMGMFSVPLMLQVAPYDFVIGLWLPVLMACDVATIRRYPRQWSLKSLLPIAPGILVGIAMGASVLALFGNVTSAESWLKLGVGVLALVFLVLTYAVRALRGAVDRHPPWKPTYRVGTPLGVSLGIATTLAHAGGPMLMMYLLPQRLDKHIFVGTCGRFYFFFNGVKVLFFLGVGMLHWGTLRYGVWLMLLGLPLVWLGWWINQRISVVWFVRIIELGLALAAMNLVWNSLPVLTMD